MSTPKEWRLMHGASGLNFDLAEVRERYATCVRFEHLPELQDAKERYERILDEVDIPWRNIQSMVLLPERREIHLSTGHVPTAPGPYRKLVLWD